VFETLSAGKQLARKGIMNSNPTIGFDLSAAKMTAYTECRDPTGEVSIDSLRAAVKLG